ncbi:hypothetical protein BGW37DRAFT_480043 [Umbelopsis sp. PMI_123]|nr:hypothetical protein BGW37DRAFT_480043 [Umbelopsis sp. PMI_123]
MNVLSSNSTFWRFCDENVCNIDWRLTLVGGQASHALTIVNIVNIAWSAVLLICGVTLLVYRIGFKGHRLWEQQDNGRIRPKPIEAMLALLMMFTILRIVDSVVLLTDAGNNNIIFRSFLYEIPWQFGFAAFSVYLIGIATTLAQSHQAISTGWLPSARQVDILAIFLIFAPFITNNICSIAAGIYAQNDNLYVADILTRLLYAFWSMYCFVLTISVLYSGTRLVNVMGRHIRKFSNSTNGTNARILAIRNGRSKIVIIMLAIVGCLACFALMLLMYGIFRNDIMTHLPASIAIGTIWNFLGPSAITFVEIAIATNPRLPTFGLKNSSHNQSNGTIKTPTPAFGSDWGSGMSSSTYDQQNISGIYTAGEHPMQPPDSYQAKRYQSPTTNVALNIIQYHKDNFIRSEERMIGNIPRRADSRSSHSELIG